MYHLFVYQIGATTALKYATGDLL